MNITPSLSIDLAVAGSDADWESASVSCCGRFDLKYDNTSKCHTHAIAQRNKQTTRLHVFIQPTTTELFVNTILQLCNITWCKKIIKNISFILPT